ncbi:nucleotidyltransferase domain-containing protein [Metabacillus endolithicus]|uniref:Nucleotidyltransferase family protein n=1 Tax=Metabacillus endolithicus TaxID=1535204 RepID=A0ABW5BWL4_9BACI|nr:nucleotidyltransferase family protein [Metabacillus endolithicus]UPG64489.1 nucleotidyltransferase family protein [Metabacillus endolithicus]
MIKKFIKDLYYNPSLPFPYSNEEYKELEADIIHFNLEPLFHTFLKQTNQLDNVPINLKGMLLKKYNQQFIQNLLIKNQTQMILSAFEVNNIYVIPLKGPFFSEKYFNDFAARTSSDIDILIKEDQIDKTITCIKNLGFVIEESNDEGHFHRTFSKTLPGSTIPLLIEIHWNIVKENTSSLPIDELWNQSRPLENYQFVKQLSTIHTFYFIILHAWRHNLDSLKHFLDIIQMIHTHGNDLNYESLFKIAKKHRTHKRVIRTLSIVYQQFPFLNNILKLPITKQYGSLWQYEWIRGGKVDKKKLYLDFIDYQFRSYDTFLHRLIALFEWLFPSKFGLAGELKGNKMNYLRLFKQRGKGILSSILIKSKI